ncbi:beta strand repeat-containing protein [Haloferula rosea]|uniref:Autotransporter-associated beta strand repeat-containing protein n=1 Tax=Haloferula rosea TaxID=490093 RepID=A0A934RC30_9BACT|nr:autotransporter-associated beta strand repeat-containing protein [Haloferula rosea]MBK1825720.1 autotransporter-associated beta strand repeat-containing protein [Haloferula rosea]
MNSPSDPTSHRGRLLRAALRTCTVYVPGALLAAHWSIAPAQTISVNLAANESNGSIDTSAGSASAGAIPISGEFWNNGTGANGSLAAGTVVDDSGSVVSGFSSSWTSNNTWRSASGGATATSENGALTRGYLDDGGGWSVDIISPFLTQDLYIIHATDQGSPANMSAVSVGGNFYIGDGAGGTISVADSNNSWTASNWSGADTLTESDNYLRIEDAASPDGTLSISALQSSPGRAAIAGFQIENTYSGTLSHWDVNGAATGAGDTGAGTLNGTWGSDSYWSSDPTGESSTGGWTSGHAAVFSAGTDGINSHTITLSGSQAADAVWVKNGQITLSGGTLNLSGGLGLLRADDALVINSAISATNLTTRGNITLGSAANNISGLVTLNDTITLAANQSFNQISGLGTASINSGVDLTIGSDGSNNTFEGTFSGDGSITKSGSGELTLLKNHSGLMGGISINDGTLTFSNANGGYALEHSIVGNGELRFEGSGSSDPSLTAGGDLSGFSGDVSIGGARVSVDSSGGNRLGTGNVTVESGGQLWISGGTLTNNVSINGIGTSEGAGNLGAIRFNTNTSLNGDITLESDSRLTTWTNATGVVNGAIIGTHNLEKTGSGNLVINSTGNTGFSGSTTVSQGILRIADDSSLGTVSGAATADAIILQGGGRIQGGTSSGGVNLNIAANRGVTIASGDSGFHTWTGFVTTVESDIVGDGRLTTSDGGTLVINGDTNLNGGLFISNGTTTINGDLNLTGGTIRVQGNATLNINSSSAFADGGFDLGRGTTNINLGNGAGGTLQLDDWELGNNGNQPHVSNLIAGDVLVTNDVRIGHWGNSDSSINVSGGSLSQPDTVTNPNNEGQANLMLGIDGTGYLNISGGTVNTTSLTVDGRSTSGGTETLTLTGGILNIGQWGIRNNGSYLIQFGGGTVGTTSSSTVSGYDWSSSWSSSSNIEFTGTNGDTSFQAGAHTITLSGDFSGVGGFSVDSGTLVLDGTNSTYTGDTVVNGGTLYSNGSATGVSSVIVANGGTLRAGTPLTTGTATFQTLELQAGSSSLFRVGASADQVIVSGSNGLTTGSVGGHSLGIAPVGQVFVNDEFTVIDYDGTIQGAGFGGLTAAALPNPHYGVSLVDDVANTAVKFRIDSIDSVVWKGSTSADWNVETTSNFALKSNSTTSNFYTYDVVEFDDTATEYAVNLDGTITPAAVLFNNTTSYSLTGDGIGGASTLTKSGTGTLTLTNDNTFTGATTISGGTLHIGDGTTGSISGASAITNDGTLELDLANGSNFANLVANNGTMNIEGSGSLTLSGGITGNGVLNINSSGVITSTAGGVSLPNIINVNSGTLRLNNSSFAGNRMTGNGVVTVESGATLEIATAHGLGGYPGNSEAVVLNGGTLLMTRENYFGSLTMRGATVTGPGDVRSGNNSNFLITGSAASTVSSVVSNVFTSNWTVEDATGSSATDLLISGTIIGSAAMVKNGAGTLEVTGNNTYTGTTTINGGTLLVNNGSGSGTGTGTLNVTAAATLAGAGTIGGNALVDGTIAPGNSPGTLGFEGDLGLNSSSILDYELNPMDLTPGGGINDLMTIAGNFTLDGLLQVTASSGDFTSANLGDTWTLATYAGSLVDNGLELGAMPTLDPTYSWSVSSATPGVVSLTIIPEPRSLLLVLLGGLALARRRRA